MVGSWSIRQVLLRTLIVALVLEALIGIGVLLFGTFGKTEAKILGTTLTISYFSLMSLGCAAAYEKRASTVLGIGGMIVAAVGFILYVPSIWAEWIEYEAVGKTMAVLGVFSFSFAHASLLCFASLKRETRWVLYSAQVAIFALAAVISAMIVFEVDDERMLRLVGVLGILDGCLSLCVPILHLLGARQSAATGGWPGPDQTQPQEQAAQGAAAPWSGPPLQQVELWCPRCRQQGAFPLGRIACPNCALVLRIEIEEGIVAPGPAPGSSPVP